MLVRLVGSVATSMATPTMIFEHPLAPRLTRPWPLEVAGKFRGRAKMLSAEMTAWVAVGDVNTKTCSVGKEMRFVESSH